MFFVRKILNINIGKNYKNGTIGLKKRKQSSKEVTYLNGMTALPMKDHLIREWMIFQGLAILLATSIASLGCTFLPKQWRI